MGQLDVTPEVVASKINNYEGDGISPKTLKETVEQISTPPVASRHTRGPIDKKYHVRPLSGLSQNNNGVSNITCVPNSANDMECCINSFRGRGLYWACFFVSAIVSTHTTKCIRNVLHTVDCITKKRR